MSVAMRALPAQNPHMRIACLWLIACAGCGHAPFAKKPAFLLAPQAEPAHGSGSRGGGTGRPPKDKKVFKMGNRAVIITPDKNLALYLHWNGGRDTVEPLLKYCELQGYRPPEPGLLRVSARRTAPRTPRRASLPRRRRRASPRPVPRARGRGPRSSPPRTRGPTL